MRIPAKYAARFINGNAFKPSDWGDQGLPILRIAQLSGQPFDNFYDGNFDERYRIVNGDLLFAWSATIDSYYWNRGEAVLNQHIFKVIPRNGVSKRFLYYSLKHYSQIWADFDAHGSTTRHIKKESLSNKIFLPDINNQEAIADFLDRETLRITQLIEKKQQMVDLLQEKLSREIEQAVTGGIDNHYLKKQTNIPWLPEIPDHWEVKRAKFLFSEAQRIPQENDKIITAFRDGQVTLRENRRTEGYTFAIKEVGYQHIKAGDLVINTMDAFAGAIGVSDSDGKATGEYAVCEAKSDQVNNHYYANLLRCMAKRDYIFVLCPSVRERAPRFRFIRFAPVFLPVPPRFEQDKIVEHIGVITKRIEEIKAKTDQSLERLREYRSNIITAVVTGQIDITTWSKRGETDRQMEAIEAEIGNTSQPALKEVQA